MLVTSDLALYRISLTNATGQTALSYAQLSRPMSVLSRVGAMFGLANVAVGLAGGLTPVMAGGHLVAAAPGAHISTVTLSRYERRQRRPG